MDRTEAELRQIVENYKNQLRRSNVDHDDKDEFIPTRQYSEFRSEIMPPHLTIYEKLCQASAGLVQLTPEKKKVQELQEYLNISHLNVTPTSAYTFSVLSTLIIVFVGAIVSIGILQSFFAMFIFLMLAMFNLMVFGKLPEYVANKWRLKASNQMVLCVFYVATYMRHTSNLENALEFASDHITPPLSLDLKKVLWDVETEKYDSVKESLESYLTTWRKWNMEFIESFHLIEASLLEPSEERRLSFVDKALEVILEETYEKMLHYAHNLKNPITMLHMLGVILPILGLVILPLIVSFMGSARWYHIAALYNLFLPLGVYYLGKSILSKRPTGYGDSDITKTNPELEKYKKVIIKFGGKEILISPMLVAGIVGGILLFIGLTPLMLHAMFPDPDFDIEIIDGLFLLGYRRSQEQRGVVLGPYGLGATILSLFVPVAIGVGIGTYYHLRSKKVINLRKDSKDLEQEFASGLFQLGNRIGDGLPIEIAFSKVAQVMQGTKSGEFFTIVSGNITKMGMSLRQAIFDKRKGALTYFPSSVISSSMEVLIQSAQKGPEICSQALMNISQYIKEIHRVSERLRDLLSEIISSMKSQIKFLAPAISGIVVGITSMIATIMGKLSGITDDLQSGETAAAAGSSIPDLFGDGIATYFFQIVVGIYVVQIVYILTILANGVENGSDNLNEAYMLGKNLRNSIIMYAVIAGIVTLMFNLVALQILDAM